VASGVSVGVLVGVGVAVGVLVKASAVRVMSNQTCVSISTLARVCRMLTAVGSASVGVSVGDGVTLGVWDAVGVSVGTGPAPSHTCQVKP